MKREIDRVLRPGGVLLGSEDAMGGETVRKGPYSPGVENKKIVGDNQLPNDPGRPILLSTEEKQYDNFYQAYKDARDIIDGDDNVSTSKERTKLGHLEASMKQFLTDIGLKDRSKEYSATPVEDLQERMIKDLRDVENSFGKQGKVGVESKASRVRVEELAQKPEVQQQARNVLASEKATKNTSQQEVGRVVQQSNSNKAGWHK